mgnify:CR=1 FL=1
MDDFVGHCGTPIESFRFARSYQLHLIHPPKPGTPFPVLGAFGFKTDKKPTYTEQYFVLERDGLLSGKTSLAELTILMRLSSAIERRFKDQDLQVIDVRLPKSQGFSGIKYGYRQVLELFPHLKWNHFD